MVFGLCRRQHRRYVGYFHCGTTARRNCIARHRCHSLPVAKEAEGVAVGFHGADVLDFDVEHEWIVGIDLVWRRCRAHFQVVVKLVEEPDVIDSHRRTLQWLNETEGGFYHRALVIRQRHCHAVPSVSAVGHVDSMHVLKVLHVEVRRFVDGHCDSVRRVCGLEILVGQHRVDGILSY